MTVEEPAQDLEPTSVLALWSDEPATQDLLAFDAVAETLVDALLDDALDPVALGVSGRWGSGKTTVLRLIEQRLLKESEDGQLVLPIRTDPWRYDPALGPKESLISVVLKSLGDQVNDEADDGGAARKLLGRLAARVDWAKALKLVARTAMSPQIPSLDSLLELVKAPGDDEDAQPRTLEGFTEDFEILLGSDGLAHIRRVVVLVDDLDRCLPTTVVETLETIRLFLAVPGMSFVIAADEDRVSEAIAAHFPTSDEAGEDAEHPSRLYLHKIVQTTIPLPTLSRFDTQAYLLLLQVVDELDEDDAQQLIGRCSELRSHGATLDDIVTIGDRDLSEELSFAARLTPILYEKLKGNPRRIKRFLNDLQVRQNVAARRGISLDAAIVAKLMVLEQLVPDGFTLVLKWMASGELRAMIAKLEDAAGRPADEPAAPDDESAADGVAEADSQPEEAEADSTEHAVEPFSDEMLRWGRLPPSLAGGDLSPYLHLAAGFRGRTLLDEQLPERLRDLAANLLSSSRLEQRSVTAADIAALRDVEPSALVQHLGRAARDRPDDQRQAVSGILRVLASHPSVLEQAKRAFLGIPASEVEPAAVLLFQPPISDDLQAVLRHWLDRTENDMTRSAIEQRLASES